jgi:AraC-like DNA-binding protein
MDLPLKKNAACFENPLLPVLIDPNAEDTRPHSHSESELLLVRKGGLTVELEGHTHFLAPGQVLFIGSQQPHCIRPEQGSPDYVSLRFDLPAFLESGMSSYLPYFEEYTRIGSMNASFLRSEDACREAAKCIDEICRETAEKSSCYELSVSMHIKKLLLLFIRSSKPGTAVEYCSTDRTRMKPVLDYVEAHLDERITVWDVCRLVHMSYNYFVKFFKKVMGSTFVQYVQTQKMRRAEELLLTRSLSVNEICIQINMESMAHFYKLFKRQNGCSPRQFQSKMDKAAAASF